jgi:hypothetical protein
MKYRYATFALICALGAVPAAAFEVKDPNREKPQLKIELEPAPSQVQRDFDQYVQELARDAQRDAVSPPEKKDRIKELQAEAVNPLVLFRW